MGKDEGQGDALPQYYDDVPKYVTLIAHFRALIADGVLVPGDRFPGEPAMSARYDVARKTARRVLDALLETGEIYSVVGKGTFVSDPETGGAPNRD